MRNLETEPLGQKGVTGLLEPLGLVTSFHADPDQSVNCQWNDAILELGLFGPLRGLDGQVRD